MGNNQIYIYYLQVMENKLEQLLNSLVDAWWKPRWLLNEIEYIHAFDDVNQWWRVEISYGEHWYYKSLRQIASKESWLWQFCEENKMLIWFSPRRRTKNAEDCYWLIRGDIEYRWSDYEYRLIQSALKDESELENFLLQSIVINND